MDEQLASFERGPFERFYRAAPALQRNEAKAVLVPLSQPRQERKPGNRAATGLSHAYGNRVPEHHIAVVDRRLAIGGCLNHTMAGA